MSEQGNLYDNFQMLGYVEGASPFDAVAAFFDQPKFPIVWADVEYMWANGWPTTRQPGTTESTKGCT